VRYATLLTCYAILLLALAGMPVGLAAPQTASECPALPPPPAGAITVSSVDALVQAVNTALPNATILITPGTYNLAGAYLLIDTPGFTLRSAGGDRASVILDGGYSTTEIIQIVASDITIADLTLRRAVYHPVHIMSSLTAHTSGVRLYNLHIQDPGQQAVKINPVDTTHLTDNGEVACSLIVLTDAGRAHVSDCYTGGIDAHQSRGWVVRDNTIRGFWCDQGLSEHAVHFWRGSRDTLVERNLLVDNARGVGFGLVTPGSGRTYPDNPCPGASGYVDHFTGTVRNNFVFASDTNLFASDSGFDCGICFWNACQAAALHNTIYTSQAPLASSIEWRFPNSSVEVYNNLSSHNLWERDSATSAQAGNLTGAQPDWFVDSGSGDLHLLAGSPPIDSGVTISDALVDIDAQFRPIGLAPDAGADEYGFAGQRAVFLPLLQTEP
jgi:hypothetical protein